MATMIEFQVKSKNVSIDWDSLTKETQFKLGRKGIQRLTFERETPEKEVGDLDKAITAIQNNPEAYYSTIGTKGEGISRPKQTPYEKYANTWFGAFFLPELKLNVEKRVKVWAKYGGSGLQLKAAKEATAEVKEAIGKNLIAKAAVVKAMADLMTKNGFVIPE